MVLRDIRAQGTAARRIATLTLALLFTAALVVGTVARAEEEAPAAPTPLEGTGFDSPEAAAKALIEAAAKNDDAAMKALFGPKSEDLVLDGSDPTVAADRAEFAKVAGEKMSFDKVDDASVILVIGENAWPMPTPLVLQDGKWYFDAEAGREEILARRIGRNELEAIAICGAYVGAQVQYASEDRDGDGVREYAQKIASTPGQQDGLYWETDEASQVELSPLGPLIAPFADFKPGKDGPVPFNGYYWKILPAQGANAPGGAYSYVINGNMIAGFALVGVPAQYMNTGIMTFVVSNHGKVLEKDLGEKSLEIVSAMEAFDPDDSWKEPSADE